MGKLKCNECGADMRLDDIDTHFRGCRDNYWECTNCQTGCIQAIFEDKPHTEYWYTEKSGKIEDYTRKVEDKNETI